MAVTHHIGFEIADGSFRLVEMRSTDGYPVVLRTSVMETELDFSSAVLHTAPFEYDVARAFVRDIARILHARPVLASSVTLTLATHLPVLATIPVDTALTPEERRRQLEWECRRLLGAADTDGVTLLSTPVRRGSDGTDLHLATALPTSTVTFLRAAFGQLTFDVRGIEISHFVIENGIRAFTPGIADTRFAVLGLSAARCTVGVWNGREYRGFRSCTISPHAPALRQALECLHRTIATQPEMTIESVFIYGSAADDALCSQLRGLLGIPVRVSDPLSRVSFLAGSDGDDARRQPRSSLDASVYAAWKGATA